MCDERERLIGYVYGECDAEDRDRVGSHLASETLVAARLLQGAAGGMLTTAVMFAEPAQNASAASAASETVPVGYREADLTEIEQRLLQRLRNELAADRVSLPTAAPVQTMPANIVTDTELGALENRVQMRMLGYLRDLSKNFTDDLGDTNDRVSEVAAAIEDVKFRTTRTQGPGHN